MAAILDTTNAPATDVVELDTSLLDQIVEDSRVARSSSEHARARDIISELVTQVMAGTVVMSNNLSATLDARLAELDAIISTQLSAIMHAPAFQKLERSWTGLHYLVQNSTTSSSQQIRMLNATKRELVKDFQAAMEFDQSTLFKKVYEEEFGTFGGAPYGSLIGDFEMTRQPEDVYFLEQMSHVAAASHAPFITSCDPELFGVDSFSELGKPRDLAKIFDTAEYAKWKAFRDSEDARYVGLTLPRFLGRLPFNPVDGATTEGFNFVEDVDGKDHQRYLWCNAAYAFGTKLMRAFEDYGWCAAIRGVEGGGLVENLPTHTFKTDEGEVALKCPTELSITDRREKELQKHVVRRILRRAVGTARPQIRHRCGERQRRAVVAAAIHLRRVAHRALHEGNDARQDRQLRRCRQRRRLPESLADPVRTAGRQRQPGAEGAVPLARSKRAGVRSAGPAGRVPGGLFPPSAFPA
jgi:type VI secretion system protein ImpC